MPWHSQELKLSQTEKRRAESTAPGLPGSDHTTARNQAGSEGTGRALGARTLEVCLYPIKY